MKIKSIILVATLILTITAILFALPPKYEVLKDKCIGCNLCVSKCPTNAIEMKGGKAVIDPEKCIGCGICVNGNKQDFNGCPVAAIKLKEEEKAIKDTANQVIEAVQKAYYKVRGKDCISCRLCVSKCPVDAIEMIDGKAVIDAEKCTACGICKDGNGVDFRGCPVNAIDRVETKQ